MVSLYHLWSKLNRLETWNDLLYETLGKGHLLNTAPKHWNTDVFMWENRWSANFVLTEVGPPPSPCKFAQTSTQSHEGSHRYASNSGMVNWDISSYGFPSKRRVVDRIFPSGNIPSYAVAHVVLPLMWRKSTILLTGAVIESEKHAAVDGSESDICCSLNSFEL